MKPFQLTNKAKSDLKDIALFTFRRWGREQRNVYLKQFDESFWLPLKIPTSAKLVMKSEMATENSHKGAMLFFINKLAAKTSRSSESCIRVWM